MKKERRGEKGKKGRKKPNHDQRIEPGTIALIVSEVYNQNNKINKKVRFQICELVEFKGRN